MNEKYIERPKKFNQREYDKTHFKQFNVKIKPDLWDNITQYCDYNSISKAEFLRIALESLEKQS